MKKIRLSWKRCRILLMVICMLAAGICYSCRASDTDGGSVQIELESREPEAEEETEESHSIAEASAASAGEPSAGEAASAEPALVYVHVCGCVNAPGVYALPEGSRIYEALEAAGGITEEGAGDFLNLALEAEDGMKVEVPDAEQARLWREQGIGPAGDCGNCGRDSRRRRTPWGAAQTAGSRVNLNTASREELMTLDGIGETRADAIIRYREMYGGFQAIEDVMNVSGIKEGAFEKIKDSITV